MTPAEWREMAQMMGVENMGGPAVGFLPELPTATVARGSTAMSNMAGMDHSKMNMPAAPAAPPASMPGMNMPSGETSGMKMPAMDNSMQPMMELHMKMMEDPVIRSRMMADPEMRRMMTNMMNTMPADHREIMQRMMSESRMPLATHSAAARKSSTKSTTAKKKTTAKSTEKKPAKKNPMPGMDHSKMKM